MGERLAHRDHVLAILEVQHDISAQVVGDPLDRVEIHDGRPVDLPEEVRIELARKLLPGVWARPFGAGDGFAYDHVHLDLGYATVVPHDAPGEDDGGEP